MISLVLFLGRPSLSLADSREADYFFSSFFGLHFSQTLPSFLAFTQHLCSHSLPAAFAFSQQVSARTPAMLPRRNKAQMIPLMDFIVITFLTGRLGPAISFVFLEPDEPSRRLSLKVNWINYRRTIV